MRRWYREWCEVVLVRSRKRRWSRWYARYWNMQSIEAGMLMAGRSLAQNFIQISSKCCG